MIACPFCGKSECHGNRCQTTAMPMPEASPALPLAPTPPTDNATPEVVLLGVLECALGWEGGARLLGNVRAMDIQRAIQFALSALRRAKVEQERSRQVAREVGRKYFAGLAGQDAERVPYRLTPNQQELLEVVADAVAESTRAKSSPSPGAVETPTIDCPACGARIKQIASATLSLALWQHWNWACPKRDDATALAVLRDLEWSRLNDGRGVTQVQCPACFALQSRGTGHNPHCGLAAALRSGGSR